MNRFLVSAATLMASLALTPVALAQPGAKPQPGVEGAPAKAAETPKTEPPSPLLTDPSAVEVAVYQCSELSADCPIRPNTAQTIASRFQQPMRTGTGQSTDLATALLGILKGTFAGTPVWDPGTKYAAIHLVNLDQAATGVIHDRWILAARGRGDAVELSQRRRIFGTHRLTVLFIYVNAETATGATEDVMKKAYIDVSYRAVVKEKRSVAFEHLLGVLALAGTGQFTTQKVGFIGYGTLTDIPTPSDVSVIGVRTREMKAVGQTVQYDNEGKSYWDASVAVPVNKLSLLDYSQEGATFVPKQINKQSIYGVASLYVYPVDLKEGKARWLVPRIIGGLGFTGRPGENVLVGVAGGIPELQFFVGRAYAAQRLPKEGTDASNPANLEQKYKQSWSFGLNVPVVSALKKLQAKGDKAADAKKAAPTN